jgi:protein-disulfide isomerase
MKTYSLIPSGLLAVALVAIVALTGCVSSGSDSRLRAMEARQDSILAILRTMQSQSEFVALRVGWRPPADTSPKNIPVGASFTYGPANAAVTLVEFSDFQCPYCARLSPVLDSVARAYPRDVRLVYKHFPLSFHAEARPAAAAAIAAGNQGRFFEFRARVMPFFRDLNEELYLSVARELGLDMNRFRKEMALTDNVNAVLDADIELGRKVGVEGTPTIFVNGRLAEDRSYEYFAGIVEQARARR